MICSIGNLTTSIEYIDFTKDNLYMMYKDNFEEVAIIDIVHLKKTNTIFIENDVEWCSDAIKVSEKTKGVHSHYQDENRITKIT